MIIKFKNDNEKSVADNNCHKNGVSAEKEVEKNQNIANSLFDTERAHSCQTT